MWSTLVLFASSDAHCRLLEEAMGGTFNKAANGDNKKWKTVKAMRCKSQNECIDKLAFTILVRQKIGKNIRAYFLQELPSWV